MRTVRLLLWPAGVAVGVAAELVYFGLGHPGDWLPDLAVGWTLIACGLLAWSRRPNSHSGALLAASGFAWFAANFSDQALYLHRGPLIHLVLSYPDGRLRGRLEGATVAGAYAIALIPAVWGSEQATLALAVFVVAVAARAHLGALGRERRARLAALQATGFVAAVLAGTAAVRLAFTTQTAVDATLWAYQTALCALAVGLLVGLVREPWARAQVTDLVVELGETRSGSLRDGLARALGDPTLEVGYWVPAGGIYVDASGRQLDMSSPGPDRRVTPIELDGQRVAALMHDSAVLEDRGLLDSLAAAARLAAANARLQTEVRVQVSELVASRLRLVQAGDEERRRLEQRLHDSAERRLTALAQELERTRDRPGTARDAAERVRRAEEHLALTLAELRELAAGLHPRVLSERGLPGAIAELAAQSPVPVAVSVSEGHLPEDIEVAAYFVCSEALANVAKYAAASSVSVSVGARNGRVLVEVADDGAGGAVVGAGSGLRGLADRVEALGGSLRLDSPPGAGTRLTVELPLAGQEHGARPFR
ncbi:MAG TPA: ATP-binding protein [Thermoleophilaceae bacterium]|nr:ATP-binding protein [Thermoleophilaceae bacterium]